MRLTSFALRVALILGLSPAAFSAALADGRAVLPPRWMVEAYLSDALVKPSRDDIARAIIPGLGMVPAFMGGGASLIFVGASTISNASSGNISYPAGTAVGDICIVSLVGSPTFGGSGTWTTAINGNGSMAGISNLYVYIRILQAGDISSPPSFTNSTGSICVHVWRGGTSISMKTGPTTGTGANLTLSGFVKNAACKGVIIAGYDRADSIGVTTVPSPFIKRNEQRGSYHQMTFADCDSPGAYTDSSSISWTGWNTTYDSNVGAVFEVT